MVLVSGCAGPALATELQPKHLRCEYLVNPLGLDVAVPRLSWEFQAGPDSARGTRQTAWQLLVASRAALLREGQADLWDSGKIVSEETIGLEYAGRKLRSGERCHWKVRVWNQAGQPSPWSETAFWTMGLLDPQDWKAKWIGVPELASRKSNLFRDWKRTLAWKQWPAPPRVPAGSAVQQWIDATKMKVEYFIPKDIDGSIWGIERLEELQPAPLFRREFTVGTAVKRATLYLCGLGCYALWINGKKVDERELDPAQADYDKHAFYVTFDVTRFLQRGTNAIGIMLGDGFYRQTVAFARPSGKAGDGENGLIAQLDVERDDGPVECITSDHRWKCSVEGPLIKNNIFAGNLYDARREIPGWHLPGFDDRTWSNVEIIPPLTPRLDAQKIPPLRVVETVQPVALTKPKPGVWVFDMGVQLFGYTRLKVDAPAGTILTLRYVESLKPDGTKYELGRMACNQADVYVCKGGGEEWIPNFTCHAFRYVQVEGLPRQPELGLLEGLGIANDIEPVQRFACSNDLLNRIHAMFVRTVLQAAQHKFGSDTARERSCWLGNAPLLHWVYSFNAWTLYEKTMADMEYHKVQMRVGGKTYTVPPSIILEPRGAGYPEGVLAGMRIWWEAYLCTGNLQLLEHLYPRMQETMRYMAAVTPTGVYDSWLGDWHDALPQGQHSISADGESLKLRQAAKKNYRGVLSGGAGGFPANTPPAVPPTARLYQCARNMAVAARLLGRTKDAEEYDQLAHRIKAGFIAKFYDPDQATFGSQTANAAALWQGLVPPDSETKVLKSLVDDIMVKHKGHFSTGIFGTHTLLDVLLSHGRDDVAYTLMTQEDFPSFGLMIAHGATTSWETWGEAILENTPAGHAPPISADRPQSHLQFLSVDAFFVQGIAGIRGDEAKPGFKGVVLRPHLVRQLDWARADFQSVRGLITSDWKRQGDRFIWNIVVPPNTSATVYVPTTQPGSVTESGQRASGATGVKFQRAEKDAAVFEVSSGHYHFEAELGQSRN